MAHSPLTLHEREEISAALILNPEESWALIGRRLGRHPTTIWREVEANGSRSRYRPASADGRASKNRHRSRPRQLSLPGPLRDRVVSELKQGRSPVAIWADLVADSEDRVCVETIYASLFAMALGVKPTQCLRSRRGRRRGRQRRHANKRTGRAFNRWVAGTLLATSKDERTDDNNERIGLTRLVTHYWELPPMLSSRTTASRRDGNRSTMTDSTTAKSVS